jgi:hypothetical protein
MLAARITFAHFSVSLITNLAKSVGDFTRGLHRDRGGVQLFGIDKDFDQIKHDLNVFKNNYPNGGIIVPALTLCANKRQDLIDYINNNITLPIVYPNELYVRNGGLISLGIDLIKMYGAAGEVVGNFLQNPAASQQLTLWADSLAKFEVALNTTTASGPYGFDQPKIDKLKLLASQNKIGPPWQG